MGKPKFSDTKAKVMKSLLEVIISVITKTRLNQNKMLMLGKIMMGKIL